jgi:hypothetical protein
VGLPSRVWGAGILLCRNLGGEECLSVEDLAEHMPDESMADKNVCPTRKGEQSPVGTPENHAAQRVIFVEERGNADSRELREVRACFRFSGAFDGSSRSRGGVEGTRQGCDRPGESGCAPRPDGLARKPRRAPERHWRDGSRLRFLVCGWNQENHNRRLALGSRSGREFELPLVGADQTKHRK